MAHCWNLANSFKYRLYQFLNSGINYYNYLFDLVVIKKVFQNFKFCINVVKYLKFRAYNFFNSKFRIDFDLFHLRIIKMCFTLFKLRFFFSAKVDCWNKCSKIFRIKDVSSLCSIVEISVEKCLKYKIYQIYNSKFIIDIDLFDLIMIKNVWNINKFQKFVFLI